MTTEEAIRILSPETRRDALREIPVLERIEADQEACRIAVAALRAHQERENPEPLTLTMEEVAKAYLEICGHDCIGDDSVGIPCCQFYRWPDLPDDEHPCLGECRLNTYCHKPEEGLL